MKIEEPRSRQEMETEFPVKTPTGYLDPTIKVHRRSGIDAPVRPDPSQAETYPEQLQSEAEGKRDRRTRGGRESGAMGVRRGTPVPDYRPGRSHMSGGAMESRKVPIMQAEDMEKGGTFWGGSRKQDVSQNQPMARQGTPWGRQQNEPRKQAGLERRIKGFRENPPKMGNLGDTRGQRKKSVENSLLKLMKDEESKAPKRGRPPFEPMPEVPGNEGIRTTPLSSHGYGVDSGGKTTGQKVPISTPFTVTDKPFDFAEHLGNQRKLEDMWEAVQSGKVKLSWQEHNDFAARMQGWARDEAFAREALKHHPAVSHIASNRALRNSSPVENSLLKLMKAPISSQAWHEAIINAPGYKEPTLDEQHNHNKWLGQQGLKWLNENPEHDTPARRKFNQDPIDEANQHFYESRTPLEESLLKLMKEGELIPSKVGMTRKNATRDLEKVNPQYMQGNKAALSPVAPRTAPTAAQSTMGTADQLEGGGSDQPNVANLLAYRGLSQAEGAANVASQIPGTALDAVSTVVGGIGNVLGGGKKKANTPTPPSGIPSPPTATHQPNYED